MCNKSLSLGGKPCPGVKPRQSAAKFNYVARNWRVKGAEWITVGRGEMEDQRGGDSGEECGEANSGA